MSRSQKKSHLIILLQIVNFLLAATAWIEICNSTPQQKLKYLKKTFNYYKYDSKGGLNNNIHLQVFICQILIRSFSLSLSFLRFACSLLPSSSPFLFHGLIHSCLSLFRIFPHKNAQSCFFGKISLTILTPKINISGAE